MFWMKVPNLDYSSLYKFLTSLWLWIIIGSILLLVYFLTSDFWVNISIEEYNNLIQSAKDVLIIKTIILEFLLNNIVYIFWWLMIWWFWLLISNVIKWKVRQKVKDETDDYELKKLKWDDINDNRKIDNKEKLHEYIDEYVEQNSSWIESDLLKHEFNELASQNNILKDRTHTLLQQNEDYSKIVSELADYYFKTKAWKGTDTIIETKIVKSTVDSINNEEKIIDIIKEHNLTRYKLHTNLEINSNWLRYKIDILLQPYKVNMKEKMIEVVSLQDKLNMDFVRNKIDALYNFHLSYDSRYWNSIAEVHLFLIYKDEFKNKWDGFVRFKEAVNELKAEYWNASRAKKILIRFISDISLDDLKIQHYLWKI